MDGGRGSTGTSGDRVHGDPAADHAPAGSRGRGPGPGTGAGAAARSGAGAGAGAARQPRFLRHAGTAVWRYVCSAPLTFAWAAVLLVTTLAQHAMSEGQLAEVLVQRSTNVINLVQHPLQSLVVSLFWIDGTFWFPYLVSYALFHAQVERWLGWWRWLVIGLSGHVVATLVSQGVLLVAVQRGIAPPIMLGVRDVGVSYFQAAMIGVLAHHFVPRWRRAYAGVALVAYVLPLVVQPGMTTLGHLVALLVGVAFLPLTRASSAAPWDPQLAWRRARGRRVGLPRR